MLEMNQLQY